MDARASQTRQQHRSMSQTRGRTSAVGGHDHDAVRPTVAEPTVERVRCRTTDFGSRVDYRSLVERDPCRTDELACLDQRIGLLTNAPKAVRVKVRVQQVEYVPEFAVRASAYLFEGGKWR